MFDWQTVAVALIICAAFAYTVRRGLARLGSFRATGDGHANDASCATGCGNCGSGGDKKKMRAATPAAKVLVQIGRTTDGRPR